MDSKFSPVTQVLLELEKPFQDEIVLKSGLKLYFDGSYSKNWTATVNGKIAALPSNPNPKHKKILEKLSVGDEVCVSYRIVFDLAFESDSPHFMAVTEDNERFQEYVNSKGEWVKIYAFKKIKGFGTIWAGVYQDKNFNVISGIQGTESEVSRWKAQFTFGKSDNYRFNNFFEYDGKDYWKCDLDDIFAKKQKGHIVAVGDRVIMKAVEEVIPPEIKMHIANIGDDVKVRFQDRGRVISSPSKEFKKDEIISFNSIFLEKYDFFGNEYYLINQRNVLGKWVKAA